MQCPPTATPGPVDVAERLGVGGGDHAVDVEPERVGVARELVGEARCSGRGRSSRRAWPARPPRRSPSPTPRRRGTRRRAPRRAPRRASLSPPTSFGYVARSREHAPAEHPLGAEDDPEVLARRAGRWPPRAPGRCASRVRADRAPSSRSPRSCPAAARRPMSATTASSTRQSGCASSSTYSGGTATTRSGASARRPRSCRSSRAGARRATASASASSSPSSPGNGGGPR